MELEQELEIEYKNLLTKEEYQKILKNEFLKFTEFKEYQKITQTNHYFDTSKKLLKKQGAALRIRTLKSENELTFKVPSNDFLMETNLKLTDEQVKEILDDGSFTLSQLIDQAIELNLKNIDCQSLFIHFNTFKTIRLEKKSNQNLLVLDQTFFQNKLSDYELEVEGEQPEDAKIYFQSILNKYSISSRQAPPKIARAEKNSS